MSVSDRLTQETLREILIDVCQKGNTETNIDMKTILEELRKLILQVDSDKVGGIQIEKVV